jgi:hypothetical protein
MNRQEIQLALIRERMLISKAELELKKFLLLEDIERLKNIVIDCKNKASEIVENTDPKTKQERETEIHRRKMLLAVRERELNILDRNDEISAIDKSIKDIDEQIPEGGN